MISYIKGTLAEKMEGAAVVEAGSIGYRIFMPASALELLGAVGDEVVVYTYFQVREDAMSLYGFLSRQDREMFKQLIGVNGIGPKAALGLLGTLRPDDLRLAILTGDAKAISRAPGIGAKTAQRIILDLKDKVSAQEMLSSLAVPAEAAAGRVSQEASAFSAEAAREAVDALVALGYSNLEASRAVKQVELGGHGCGGCSEGLPEISGVYVAGKCRDRQRGSAAARKSEREISGDEGSRYEQKDYNNRCDGRGQENRDQPETAASGGVHRPGADQGHAENLYRCRQIQK